MVENFIAMTVVVEGWITVATMVIVLIFAKIIEKAVYKQLVTLVKIVIGIAYYYILVNHK